MMTASKNATIIHIESRAVPAYSFAVLPLPLPAFERTDIPAQGVSFECVNGPRNPLLDVTGETLELPLCFVGEFSAPAPA